MKVKILEEESGQELVPLECKFAEAKNNKQTLLLIKNEQLHELILQNVQNNNAIEVHYSTNILYFEYDNKKYFTDKFGFVVSNSIKNGNKNFGIAFIDENDKIIGQWYNYDL